MVRRLLLLLLMVLLAGAVVVAGDWWFCLPPGRVAQYVGREQCVECHQPETQAWLGSDHDRAMDRATPQTVLGSFDDCRFLHFSFEDVARLSEEDLRTLLGKIDPQQWAVALAESEVGLGEKLGRVRARVTAAMTADQRAALDSATAGLEVVRPCDATWAREEIVQTVRRLQAEGRIHPDDPVFTRLFQRDGKFWVTTDGPDGRPGTYQVKYVFGVRPLQQYLVELDRGRIQCLPVAWDTERRRWFHLYPAERILWDDPLHWTRPLQNWNYMCAECHTTNLKRNYDLKTDTYHTTFSEIDVSCETCHGPGSLHVELAQQWGIFWDRRYGYGLPPSGGADSRLDVDACAPCHARRRVIYPDFQPGERFLDHYQPELLDGRLYYPDGQILDEDYVYGSFIQSKMYAKGVRCTDCHDAHTARVKYADPKGPWSQPIDNRLCTDCHMGTHPAGEYDTPTHHHHPDASQPGTRCVECHMPETSYMVVDPRRDHSFRNPRPDLTQRLGVPNACNLCHHDRGKGETAEWAEAQLRTWYGPRDEPPHFAPAIAAGRQGRPEAEAALAAVARREGFSAMARASAIMLLGRYSGSVARRAVSEGLRDAEGLVRAAAVHSLEGLPPDEVQRRAAPLLHDPVRAVRMEAARQLSATPIQRLRPGDRTAFDNALKEYLTGLRSLDDQPGAHLSMGVVSANLGRIDQAEAEYRTALRIDPEFVPAMVNLAMLCDQAGRKAEAAELFRGVIQIEPELAEPHYSLGLLLAENPDRMDEAAQHLAEAVRLRPEAPRMRYNYGLALQHLGQRDAAAGELEAAYRLEPEVPDYLYALAVLYSQQQRWSRALACAEELVRRFPGVPAFQGLLLGIRQEADGGEEPSESDLRRP